MGSPVSVDRRHTERRSMPISPGPRDPMLASPELPDPDRLVTVAGRLERPIWCIVAASLLLDAVLTGYGLRFGLAEANPVADLLIRRFGFLYALVALKGAAIAVALVGWAALPRRVRVIVPVGLAIPWCVAVAINAVALAGILA